MMLYSILVTTTGRPLIGSRHVIRYNGRFWVARVAAAMTGPQSTMPSWAVIWDVDNTVRAEEALAMARNRNVFALDAGGGPALAPNRRRALARSRLRAEPLDVKLPIMIWRFRER
jgi:hypothetical protein